MPNTTTVIIALHEKQTQSSMSLECIVIKLIISKIS